VRNLLEAISRTLLLGVSSTGTPLQEASSSNTPAEEDLTYLASGAGRLHLAKTKNYLDALGGI
jgi:hypothetical protein